MKEFKNFIPNSIKIKKEEMNLNAYKRVYKLLILVNLIIVPFTISGLEKDDSNKEALSYSVGNLVQDKDLKWNEIEFWIKTLNDETIQGNIKNNEGNLIVNDAIDDINEIININKIKIGEDKNIEMYVKGRKNEE